MDPKWRDFSILVSFSRHNAKENLAISFLRTATRSRFYTSTLEHLVVKLNMREYDGSAPVCGPCMAGAHRPITAVPPVILEMEPPQ